MNSPANSLKEKLYLSQQNFKNALFAFLFRPPSETPVSKTGSFLFLAIAYVAGVFHWGWFIFFGYLKDRFMDWQMFYDFYRVTQNALVKGSIPYFMPHFYKGTNQFLAIPATDLFPSIYLLKFLSVEDFFLVQLIVVYSLGFWGCVWLKRKYQWSLVSFTAFFLLFNFNGHITSHLAVGHWSWIAYFLFPFFVGWVLSLVEGDVSLRHGTRLAWVLFGMLLLGGLHPFVWCLLFLFLLCLCQKRYWKPVSIGVALAIIFSSYRLIPAAITFYGYKHEFLHGFPSMLVYWKALVYILDQKDLLNLRFGENGALPWWELDHYVAILGLGIILYFGIWSRWRTVEGESGYKILDIPILIFVIFSMGAVFGLVAYLPIPLVTVERLPSRFLILPLLILLTLSCVWMQKTFDRLQPGWGVQILATAGLLFEAISLVKHSSAWHERIIKIKRIPGDIEVENLATEWAKSMEEYYIPAVQASYLISLIALIAFLAGALYFKMKRSTLERLVKFN